MRRGARALLVLCAALGISTTSALNAFALPDGDGVQTSIPYGPGPRRTLDVYAPVGVQSAPVVVFFYGGSWQGGAKKTYGFLANALAARGVMVVVPDYRVYPQTRFPGFLVDGAQAVAWARSNAARHGGDPRRIFLMGHSAGAHIAAMLAYDDQSLRRVGIAARRDIAGFIGIAGPYDFLPIKDPAIKAVFAVRDLTRTQPINFVRGGEPPAFIGAAASDTLVDPSNSARLAARLRASGADVTEKVYSGPLAGHITIIGAFAPGLGVVAPVREDVLEFIARVSKTSRQGRGL